MAYSELIKNFQRIRDYMREFYVYGFKTRDQYDTQSPRSYDNERRRIESWLGEHMAFRQDAAGKTVFLSIDSRNIPHNPLHKAFKAKSFTAKDIVLHFYLLDLLADGEALTCRELTGRIESDYLSRFPDAFPLDESTVRKKLKEYETLGLLRRTKRGREVLFSRTDSPHPDLASWRDALVFYSEEDPLGVIGSCLLDKLPPGPDLFRFKHHYILHALDSDILCRLLLAMNERRRVELTVRSLRSGRDIRRTVCPLKIYLSVQTGRQYLLGFHYEGKQMIFLRLDAVKDVTPGGVETDYDACLDRQARLDRHLWGVSTGSGRRLDHIEMTVRFAPGEEFIFRRLEREKRHGTVERLDETTARFTADVYDAMEMLPWLRTFTGRITDLQCSDPSVTETFCQDLRRMAALYGGNPDAFQ